MIPAKNLVVVFTAYPFTIFEAFIGFNQFSEIAYYIDQGTM